MKCYQLRQFLISIFFSVFCGGKWMGGSSFLQPSPVVQQVALLQPHTSYTAEVASCCPVILLPNSNLQSPSSTVTCSGPPTCTHTTFCTTQDTVILGRSPKYLHTVPPLSLIFPDCFAWWCNHSFVLSYVSYWMFKVMVGCVMVDVDWCCNCRTSLWH
jgi:hypothetical protein